MSHPRAFISFDFDNNKTDKDLFVGQSRHSRTPFNIEDWSSKQHLPQREWEDLIHGKINKCDLLIVLVGKLTSTATGVVKEISFAKGNQIPVIGVYVDGAGNNTALPDGLIRAKVVAWEWEKIAKVIEDAIK